MHTQSNIPRSEEVIYTSTHPPAHKCTCTGIDNNKTNMWHKASKKFHDLCRTPAILDYVEDILGTNFVQWGGQFFNKNPNDGSAVPWHQDAQYWPLNPSNAVTVWLAIYDTDIQPL